MDSKSSSMKVQGAKRRVKSVRTRGGSVRTRGGGVRTRGGPAPKFTNPRSSSNSGKTSDQSTNSANAEPSVGVEVEIDSGMPSAGVEFDVGTPGGGKSVENREKVPEGDKSDSSEPEVLVEISGMDSDGEGGVVDYAKPLNIVPYDFTDEEEETEVPAAPVMKERDPALAELFKDIQAAKDSLQDFSEDPETQEPEGGEEEIVKSSQEPQPDEPQSQPEEPQPEEPQPDEPMFQEPQPDETQPDDPQPKETQPSETKAEEPKVVERKKTEVQALASVPRTQPSRIGKRKVVEIEDLEDKFKELLPEVTISEDLLRMEKLDEVVELLRFQGWDKVFSDEVRVDETEVFEFYKKVKKSETGSTVSLEFDYKGQPLRVTSMELSSLFGLKHEGYDEFIKKGWPKDMSDGERDAMQLRVCKTLKMTGTAVSTTLMDPAVKVLHKLLVSTLLPRGSKSSLVQIQDILLLDKIMRKEPINLPKLIIHHMAYISTCRQVGHARFVKKVLDMHRVYKGLNEVSASKDLDLASINVTYDEDQGGLIRGSKKRKVGKAKQEEPKPEGSWSEGVPDMNARFGDILQKVQLDVADIKEEFQHLNDTMREYGLNLQAIKRMVQTLLADKEKSDSAKDPAQVPNPENANTSADP